MNAKITPVESSSAHQCDEELAAKSCTEELAAKSCTEAASDAILAIDLGASNKSDGRTIVMISICYILLVVAAPLAPFLMWRQCGAASVCLDENDGSSILFFGGLIVLFLLGVLTALLAITNIVLTLRQWPDMGGAISLKAIGLCPALCTVLLMVAFILLA